jgi:isopentenyl diphosphate isomerase/L-lactate dehydrogenase-like FMN-dependent dehydrogenase
MYWFTDLELMRDILQAASANGYTAIALTVDGTGPNWREMSYRLPLMWPDHLTQPILPDRPLVYERALSWESLDWLCSVSPLPVVLKGLVRPEDARLAADHGLRAVVVSNHGGRQLDACIATLDALPAVVEAVDARLEVLLDGGVRRGTDVLKALALGARAVGVGRPVQWGLAAGGQAGIERLFELMISELRSSMAGCGISSIAEISRALVQRTTDTGREG